MCSLNASGGATERQKSEKLLGGALLDDRMSSNDIPAGRGIISRSLIQSNPRNIQINPDLVSCLTRGEKGRGLAHLLLPVLFCQVGFCVSCGAWELGWSLAGQELLDPIHVSCFILRNHPCPTSHTTHTADSSLPRRLSHRLPS